MPFRSHTRPPATNRLRRGRSRRTCTSAYANTWNNVMRRSPFSLTVDALATLRSYERLMELAGSYQRIVPGHDPKVRALYPQHEFGGVALTALHELPRPHSIDELQQLPAFQTPTH